MCMWELCICDLMLLFIVDESKCESVGCLQRSGCSRSWRDKGRQHSPPQNNSVLNVFVQFKETCYALSYLSRAVLVAILLAKPLTPCCLKYGMAERLAAMMATESDGFTKKPFSPRIM